MPELRESKDGAALLSRASGENDDFTSLAASLERICLSVGDAGAKAPLVCSSPEDEDCSWRREAASLATEDFSWSGVGLRVAGERT